MRKGITTVVFGDLFLADIRKYREEWLSRIGMQAIFPLWQCDTLALAKRFIDLGFKAVVTCVDSFAGPLFQHQVPFIIGEVVQREFWYFCDLLAA